MDEPEFNPYAPPTVPIDPPPAEIDDEQARIEAIRRKYLSHEASVKSIGSLHYLAVLGCVVPIFFRLATYVTLPATPVSDLAGFLAAYAVIAAFHLSLGIGLTDLKTWARWVEVVIVGISLAVMLGALGLGAFRVIRGVDGDGLWILAGLFTLIPAYMLYLLASPKGTFVFSREYRAVIDRTPQMQYRSSCLVWFLIMLIVGGLVIAVIGSIRGGRP